MLFQSSIDIEKARDFLRRKRQARKEELDRRFARAWEDFRRIAEVIREKYHPRRIYQWGSLLNREQFSEISDIDIAVEGIKTVDQFFAMYGEALRLASFPLDLVEIEKIHPLHARDIRERGRLVHEEK